MNPPRKVKVGPLTYVIDVGGERFKECQNSAPGFLYGQTHAPTTWIGLNPMLAPAQMKSTLWHELQHAIFHVHDPDNEEFWKDSKDFEEDWIRLTSPTSLQVLMDNPKLVLYLTERS